MSSVADCRIVRLPTKVSAQGCLTPFEGAEAIPFDIARVYYLYDIPDGASRGGHAYRELEQVVVCALGSFEMLLDDGTERRAFTLRHADEALYVPRGIWRELRNFSSGAVCFTLSSTRYEESDYIRDYDEFVRFRRGAEAS